MFLRTPHVGWEKWSRNCSNSKHSRDITIVSLVTQWIIPGNLNFPPARTQTTQRAQRTQYRRPAPGSALPSTYIFLGYCRNCKIFSQHRSNGGRSVSGGGNGAKTAVDAASHASYIREKAEILKTWEILAFTVRPYEYRR